MDAGTTNIETFFSYSFKNSKKYKSENKTDFLSAPYPCLNPVCRSYKKRNIDTFEIKSSNRGKYRTLFINCSCGFSYYRNGPDIKDEDIYCKDSVRTFGKLWENELVKLWKDETLSIHKISKLLGVYQNAIERAASVLKLRFPRKDTNGKIFTISEEVQERYRYKDSERKNKAEILQKKIEDYRKKWLSELANNSSAKRSELSVEIVPKIAGFLRTYDREWFYSNQPKAWKRTESARQIDWKIRDEECADKVRQIASAIKSQEGKPIWVKPGSIAQKFENRNWITHSKYIKKMPLTQEALKEVTETRIDYNVRRIQWAVNCIKEDGSSFAVSFIGQRAVVDWSLWEIPEIKQAIEEGIKEIKNYRGFV